MALLADLPPDVVASVAETTFVVCTGQLRETEHAYDLDLDLDTYLDILRMKTASLFELPCRIGAMLAGLAPRQVDAIACYGSNLGIAFQLIDDLLDFEGETTALGKPTGTDLDRGIYSYPVLFALRGPTGATLRERLGASETVGAAAALVRASGAPTATGELARQYSDRAVRELDVFPDTAARSALRALTDLVIARDR
jgi:geranylgeranyl pyrophosphate synthase